MQQIWLYIHFLIKISESTICRLHNVCTYPRKNPQYISCLHLNCYVHVSDKMDFYNHDIVDSLKQERTGFPSFFNDDFKIFWREMLHDWFLFDADVNKNVFKKFKSLMKQTILIFSSFI